jgi:hypothetical protein
MDRSRAEIKSCNKINPTKNNDFLFFENVIVDAADVEF